MKELVYIASLTYIAFAGAIFVVMINALVDIISDFISGIIARHKAKKYEKYIKSLPDGDFGKALYNFSKALSRLGRTAQSCVIDENDKADSVDCMGR